MTLSPYVHSSLDLSFPLEFSDSSLKESSSCLKEIWLPSLAALAYIRNSVGHVPTAASLGLFADSRMKGGRDLTRGEKPSLILKNEP